MGRPLIYVLSVGTGVSMLGGILVASRIFPEWEGYLQLMVGVLIGVAASAALYIALYFIQEQLGKVKGPGRSSPPSSGA